MAGSIVASGFGSGDRVVVGHWQRSPIGPLTDVMWASPDGARTLFVPSEEAAAFVAGVYEFDAVEVMGFDVEADEHKLSVRFGDRALFFHARRGLPIPVRRPAAFTRWVEGPIARRLLGVVTYGTSPTGVREWYRADRWRPLRAAVATVGGASLGPMQDLHPPCGFGFSEPPRRPAWVHVRPLLEYP